MCRRHCCPFEASGGPRRLMRGGLALILLGHVNLLLGAVVHGSVLRHLANPAGTVTPEYTVANLISVGSGLLSVSVGIAAILASRNLLAAGLHWVLLAGSLLNLLLSAACSLGLLLAVSLTVANGGRRLISGCGPTPPGHDTPSARDFQGADCPFDTTRIYDTALTLWLPSMVMAAAEAVLSGRCCVAALALRGVGPFGEEGLREKLAELGDADSSEVKKKLGCQEESSQLLMQEIRESRA
ncbi:keratinocyte-associated protein 3 [Tachyglossus aculeatus]|uniref:keratinocyte-associated protein 3 n=1 Tax=Tachyglossus aculeatus TaxID=9261 RepID=UPI0018F3D07D|nr:keratinocyte-associated protein 3 [Tachyglossus aculeatus]